MHGLRQRQVALWPDVRMPEREKIVDIHAPWADSSYLQEARAPDTGGRGGDGAQVEPTIENGVRQAVAVHGFLCRQAQPAEPRHSQRGDARGRHPTRAGREASVHRARRGKGHLLLEDDSHERGEPRRPGPERGRPVSRDDGAQLPVARAECARGAPVREHGEWTHGLPLAGPVEGRLDQTRGANGHAA
jgi:hypothetical protein